MESVASVEVLEKGLEVCKDRDGRLGKGNFVKKICLHCGKEFIVSWGRKEAKFCSKECCRQYRRKRIKKICIVCGKEFEVKEWRKVAKFCSRECYKGYVSKVKVACLNCGKEMEVPRYEEGRQFCSRECYRMYVRSEEYRKKRSEILKNLRWDSKFEGKQIKQIRKICQFCGKEFIVPQYDEDRKFCSAECYWMYMRRRVKKVCLVCGKEFEVEKSRKDAKFCSRRCYLEYKQIKEKEELVSKVCLNCGKVFFVKRYDALKRRFCSKECARLGIRKKVRVKCLNCGKEFEVWRHEVSKKRFCSYDCCHEYRRKREKKKCPVCSKEFEVTEGMKECRKFCSLDCYSRYRRRRVKKICLVCGKEFEIQESGKKKKFCSWECYRKYLKSEEGRKFIERQLKRIGEVKPTSLEKTVCELLQNYFPNEWQYVGDGKVFIAGFVPDFMHREKRWVVEVNGDYWHSLPKVKARDEEKKKVYERYGYKMLEIWEREVKQSPLVVLNKVAEYFYSEDFPMESGTNGLERGWGRSE
jgi:very-short-patch-repair endonuclease/endogenous inhibitor of DNA gyrase (YacG/DUF329 family)